MKNEIKILTVVGARPNFVKIAPLYKEFKKNKRIKPVLVHTGQHYDYEMSQIFFKDLDIPKPDYYLGIGSGSHAFQTAEIMKAIEGVMIEEKPDLVMVIGDVNSTLAAAIVASKLRIPIAHAEAGPRTFDATMPEETNRVLVDHISSLLFCPTKSSVANLKKENITKGVYFVGDLMYDIFLTAQKIVAQKEGSVLERYRLEKKRYILLTMHRSDNVDDPKKLLSILEAVILGGERIVFPVHPRTRKQLGLLTKSLEGLANFGNLEFIDPVGYIEMIALEKSAKKICTDSGGIQKEAFWLKVPCITLLNSQGWIETFKDGWNIAVGADVKKITRAIKSFDPKGRRGKYFGNGDAAIKIVRYSIAKFG